MTEAISDAPTISNAPTIYVCTTCRPPGEPDSAVRPGAVLATATAQAAAGTEVQVQPMRCLSNCSRGASAALRCNGSWTYVFANARGRRLAVIVNEFGDVGIDGEILKGCGNAACPEENIVELANGCLCCTVADEFVPALDAILARDGVEHIVIETSGLALSKPLVQAFHWPAIKNRVTVDGVVVVVDGAALANGRVAQDLNALAKQRVADTALSHDDPIEEVFEDQIACADLVVLNKRDLIDETGLAKARAAIADALPRSVKVIPAADGKVDQKLLLGLGVGTEDDIANRHTHHDDEEEHNHEDFDSFVVPLKEVADPAALAARVTV